jgi:hypothetical protein
MEKNENPFEELPEGLVLELLDNSKEVSAELISKFSEIVENKERMRKQLETESLLKNYNELDYGRTYPTSAAIDGSYTMERMLSLDFACVAAVAVEGLTPPGPEKRNWPKPRYFSDIAVVPHNEDTPQALRGMSAALELHLAARAPHDVVFIDGSMKTPMIFLNNAAEKLDSVDPHLRETFLHGKDALNEDKVRYPNFADVIDSYVEILGSGRSDKIYAAVPKYTTKNELCEKLNIPGNEDRGLLNFVLKSGEYVGPLDASSVGGLHLNLSKVAEHYEVSKETRDKVRTIVDELFPELTVIYFRPSAFSPVFRVEVPKAVSNNRSRLKTLLEAIELQTVSLSIMEPYPLYLADRMVKHLSYAIPAIRKAAFQEVSGSWKGDVSEVYMGMHAYRTENG